ncbi:SDR family oxidoreductase [bacterium]|nr:SDR family oxidoreductase [bacterium]
MHQALQRFSVDGLVTVVTGASSGIGRHMAGMLAEAGASLVIVARRQQALDTLAEEITTLNPEAKVASVSCDLAAVTDFDALARELSAPFGSPTRLINAAGVNFREPVDEITQESWAQTINLNLSVPFFLSRALVAGMKGNGSIINIASLQSMRAFPNSMPYGASKGGVAQLTRAMAEAWSSRGVRANAIAPGFFPTELTQAVFDDPEKAQANATQTCIGRNGKLDDLTGPAVFLCSDASAYMTGQILYVDGGFTAK